MPNKMPEPLKSHWSALFEQVVWLHGYWINYRQIFAKSEKRIDLINESARTFFILIQDIMLANVQLTLSKLADPSVIGGRTNLTLDTLLSDAGGMKPELRPRLEKLLENYQLKCEKIRHRRHKQLAHFDRQTLLNQKISPLEGPSRQEIEEALDTLRQFMNAIEIEFGEPPTAYQHFSMPEDANAMMHILAAGIRYDELVRSGSIDWDDLRKHSRFLDD